MNGGLETTATLPQIVSFFQIAVSEAFLDRPRLKSYLPTDTKNGANDDDTNVRDLF